MSLDAGNVREARAKEVQYVREKRVYVKIFCSTAIRNGWKIIKTRWIDINKGDEQRQNYRSRLVAKEFNNSEEEHLFAATPPLEALKFLLSDVATLKGGGVKK